MTNQESAAPPPVPRGEGGTFRWEDWIKAQSRWPRLTARLKSIRGGSVIALDARAAVGYRHGRKVNEVRYSDSLPNQAESETEPITRSSSSGGSSGRGK